MMRARSGGFHHPGASFGVPGRLGVEAVEVRKAGGEHPAEPLAVVPGHQPVHTSWPQSWSVLSHVSRCSPVTRQRATSHPPSYSL